MGHVLGQVAPKQLGKGGFDEIMIWWLLFGEIWWDYDLMGLWFGGIMIWWDYDLVKLWFDEIV